MDRLQRFHKLLDEYEDPDAIRNYFIGALSCWVTESDWDRCLLSARSCAEERHNKSSVNNTTKGDQLNVGSQQQ